MQLQNGDISESLVQRGLVIVAVLALVVGPVVWTIYRVLRPVDDAARDRNLPFRFSVGDFLCLFWLVQLPWAVVLKFTSNADEPQFCWLLTAGVWAIAPLAWITVARALSKAGVVTTRDRLVFLGIILPIVYYGLFPIIGISIVMIHGVSVRGIDFVNQKLGLLSLWLALMGGLIGCGIYSPRMVRHAVYDRSHHEEESLNPNGSTAD